MSRPVSDPLVRAHHGPASSLMGRAGLGKGLPGMKAPARGSSPLSLPPFTHHARSLASSDLLELIPEDFRPYDVPSPVSSTTPWTAPPPATDSHRRAFSASAPAPPAPEPARPQLPRRTHLSLYAHPKLSHPFNHPPTADMFSFVQAASSSTLHASSSRRRTHGKAGSVPPQVSPGREVSADEAGPAAAASDALLAGLHSRAPPSPGLGSSAGRSGSSRSSSPVQARFVRKLWRGRSGDSDWDFGCAGELELDEAAFAPRPRASAGTSASDSHRSTPSFGSSNRHSTASTSSSVHPPSLTHSRGSSSVSSVCLSPALPGSPTFSLALPHPPAASSLSSPAPSLLSPYTSRVPLTPRSEAKAKFQAQLEATDAPVDALEVGLVGRPSRLSRVEEVLSERGSERGSWEPRRPGGVQVEFDLSGLDLECQFEDTGESTFTPAYVPLDLELDLQHRRESDAASEATITAPSSSTFAREFAPASLAVDTSVARFGQVGAVRDGNHSPPLHSDDIASTLEELSAFFAPSSTRMRDSSLRMSHAYHHQAPPLQPLPTAAKAPSTRRHGHLLHTSGSASAPCSPQLASSPRLGACSPRLGSTHTKRPSHQFLHSAAFHPRVPTPAAAARAGSADPRRRSAATYTWI